MKIKGRLNRKSPANSVGSFLNPVPLHTLWNIPLIDIVSYSDWGRLYPEEPCVDKRQGIRDVKEQVGESSQY